MSLHVYVRTHTHRHFSWTTAMSPWVKGPRWDSWVIYELPSFRIPHCLETDTHSQIHTLQSGRKHLHLPEYSTHVCMYKWFFWWSYFFFICLSWWGGRVTEHLLFFILRTGKTHFLCISCTVQTQFYRVPVRAMRCPINSNAAKWMSVCTSAMRVFPLTLAATSTAVCSSTAPGMFLYRRLCCALLCPHVRLNGGHYWPSPRQVSVTCFRLRFLDVICF